MSVNDAWYYLLVPVSAFVTAVSQILLKISADKPHKNRYAEYLNPYVILSYAMFALVLGINVFIYTLIDYRFGVVINSLSVVFVLLLSKFLLKETLTRRKWFGNALIILGIACFTLLQ